MKKFRLSLPRYAWIPLLGVITVNLLAYYGSRLFNTGMAHYDLSIWVDGWVPFWPPAISVYILAYASWALGYLLICQESREDCFTVLIGDQIAKLLCMVFFLLLPTATVRPEVTGSGLWESLTRLIYASDTPDNLFPSIHCLENWIVFRGCLRCKQLPKWFHVCNFLFALMVFASTLLVKQHFFVDILAGVAVAELGLWISDRCGAGRLYDRLDRRLFSQKR